MNGSKSEDWANVARLQKKQIKSCIAALRAIRSADFGNTPLYLRVLMRDQTERGLGTKGFTDDCAVDLRIDRAEYVNAKSFILHVTQDEEQAPGSPAEPLQRITLHCDRLMQAPYIPPYEMSLLEDRLTKLLPQENAEPAHPSAEGISPAMENELKIPWWVSEEKRTFGPLEVPIEGAWRLTGVWEYADEKKIWYVASQELWGPADYSFGDTLTIHRPDDTKSFDYEFLPEKRRVLFDDETYFISDLTDTELVIHPLIGHGIVKFTFTRIDPSQIHEPSDAPQLELSEMYGLWDIDAEYECADGEWQQTTDYRTKPGMTFWKMSYWPKWYASEFGRLPNVYEFNTLNEQYFIFRQMLSLQESRFFHPVKDAQGYWAYLLDSMSGDYRDCKRKLHLTPVDPNPDDLFVKSLMWVETERRQQAAADKTPLELLRAWCVPNPEKMTGLLADGILLEQPELYRSEEYGGVYAFLHYFLISTKKYDTDLILNTYLKFHEILRLWLELYDAGKIVKHVYPFLISKYPEQFSALREANELQESKHITHRLITCEILKGKLEQICSTKHYLYAFMEGLNKEEFHLSLYAREDADEDKIEYSLHEFLAQYETFDPTQPVSMNFRVSGDVYGNENLSECEYYAICIKRLSGLAPENLNDWFDEFLQCYCEKLLRDNKPFTLTPETIGHFGFTDEDAQVLAPKIKAINEEVMNRIRAEYKRLAELDFIRQEFNS